MTSYVMDVISHLRQKRVNIMLTTLCRRYCAGCSQHCDVINKYRPEEIWHIPLEQFEWNLDVLQRSGHIKVSLYGGSPSLHPRWSEILKMVAEWPLQFWLYSDVLVNYPYPKG